MPNVNVVAVTNLLGPLKFNSVHDAIEHFCVTVADPIFTAHGPIDRTLIRGIGVEDYDVSIEPWDYLAQRASEPPLLPEKPSKRKGTG